MPKYYVLKKIQGMSNVMVKADSVVDAQDWVRSEFGEAPSTKAFKELKLDDAVEYLIEQKPNRKVSRDIVKDLLEYSDCDNVMMIAESFA